MAYVQPAKLLKTAAPWKTYLAVGIGGAIGALIRYAMTLILPQTSVAAFPWATFSANILGAFLLSFLLFQPKLKKYFSPITFTALTTGILGAFTSFSTIIVEFVLLIEVKPLIAFMYITSTLLGGLFVSFLAYYFVQRKERARNAPFK